MTDMTAAELSALRALGTFRRLPLRDDAPAVRDQLVAQGRATRDEAGWYSITEAGVDALRAADPHADIRYPIPPEGSPAWLRRAVRVYKETAEAARQLEGPLHAGSAARVAAEAAAKLERLRQLVDLPAGVTEPGVIVDCALARAAELERAARLSPQAAEAEILSA